LVKAIPISVTVLIKQIHILEPLIDSSLIEYSNLVELFSNYLLPNIPLPVLIVKSTVAVEIAILFMAIGTVGGLINRLNGQIAFQLSVLLFELPQENICASLGCGDKDSYS
jgi:hypothetical protein